MACIASTRSVAAAARPAAPCSSRVGCAPATPWRPAGSRAPSALQAVAGATPQAAQAPSSTAQPAHVEFPAVAVSRMLHGNRAFVEQHRIRGEEVGPDQRMSMISVAGLLQEAASNHAVAMWGRSTEGFASDPSMKGLVFVVTRMQIQMEAYPRWGDVVQVETWFQEDSKLTAQRDWVLTDCASGRVLGRATSTWVMINMQTRRLTKFPEAARAKCESFQLQPPRHAITREQTRQKLPELQLPAEIVGPIQVARRSDMDMNGHVNNVTYFAWAMETVPREIYDACHLYQMEIDFKAECHCGDLVESLASRCETHDLLAANGAGPNALSFVHVLRRCEGEKCAELVRCRTTWRAGEHSS